MAVPEGLRRIVCQGVAYYKAPAFEIPGNKVYVGIGISHTNWVEEAGRAAEDMGLPALPGKASISSETIYLGGDSPGEMTIGQAEALRDALDKIIQLAKKPPKMKTPTWVDGKGIPQDAPETQDLFV